MAILLYLLSLLSLLPASLGSGSRGTDTQKELDETRNSQRGTRNM